METLGVSVIGGPLTSEVHTNNSKIKIKAGIRKKNVGVIAMNV